MVLSISVVTCGCATPCLERELQLSSADAVVVIADDYGLIADRVCSQPDCWSETHLVRHNARVHPPRIRDEMEVPELGIGTLVHSACWVSTDEGGFFRARVSSRPEPETSYVAHLIPHADGSYVVSREE
jgi:hypothetical protein